MLTTAALVLEEFSYRRYRRGRDIARLLMYSVVENIGYQQLTTSGGRSSCRHRPAQERWGAQQRRGFVEKPGGVIRRQRLTPSQWCYGWTGTSAPLFESDVAHRLCELASGGRRVLHRACVSPYSYSIGS